MKICSVCKKENIANTGRCFNCSSELVPEPARPAPCSATTAGLEITYVPSYRYTLQWNFGKSQCSFDTAKDVADFIRNDLPNIEKHGSPNARICDDGGQSA